MSNGMTFEVNGRTYTVTTEEVVCVKVYLNGVPRVGLFTKTEWEKVSNNAETLRNYFKFELS